MEITEVWVRLLDKQRLKAFANVTFDYAFVIRRVKIIQGGKGHFVAMPSRKRADGSYQDVAHPVNKQMRQLIEEKVLQAYEVELVSHSKIEK